MGEPPLDPLGGDKGTGAVGEEGPADDNLQGAFQPRKKTGTLVARLQ